jgi:hypothetical protein
MVSVSSVGGQQTRPTYTATAPPSNVQAPPYLRRKQSISLSGLFIAIIGIEEI